MNLNPIYQNTNGQGPAKCQATLSQCIIRPGESRNVIASRNLKIYKRTLFEYPHIVKPVILSNVDEHLGRKVLIPKEYRGVTIWDLGMNRPVFLIEEKPTEDTPPSSRPILMLAKTLREDKREYPVIKISAQTGRECAREYATKSILTYPVFAEQIPNFKSYLCGLHLDKCFESCFPRVGLKDVCSKSERLMSKLEFHNSFPFRGNIHG